MKRKKVSTTRNLKQISHHLVKQGLHLLRVILLLLNIKLISSKKSNLKLQNWPWCANKDRSNRIKTRQILAGIGASNTRLRWMLTLLNNWQ